MFFTFKRAFLVVSVALGLAAIQLPLGAGAKPVPAESRQVQVVFEILNAIFAYMGIGLFEWEKLEPKPWDTKRGTCVMEVKEAKGGHCVAAASPAGEPAYTTYPDWNVCYLNGQQYFTFPDAGDRRSVGRVMIEYTGKDCSATDNGGYFTQGLCKPRITFFDHPKPLMMDMWRSTGNENDKENLCHFEVFDNYWNSWKCGVPCRAN